MEPWNSSLVVINANQSGDTLWKLVKNSSSETLFIITFVDFIITSLCALGTPGNLFVVFVYLRNMTTALRTYMFALGVADTLTCVPFIILQMRRLGIGDDRLFAFIADILVSSRVFSSLMLVYLSVDRFLFAIRPHTFGRSIRKAKVALVTIAIVSVLYTALLKVTQLSGLQQVHVIIAAFFAHLCFATVIMSYSLLAVTLLKRMRAALRKIDVAALVGGIFSRSTFTSHLTNLITPNVSVMPPVELDTRGITSAPMTSKPSEGATFSRSMFTSHLTKLITPNMSVLPPMQPDTRGITSAPMTAKPSEGATFSRSMFTSHLTNLTTPNMSVLQPVQPDTRGFTSAPMTAKPVKAQPKKRTTLTMFVVTASNALLWMPFFLKNYGFSLPEEFTRVFTINSVVNPYIYLCVSPMYRSDVLLVYRAIRSRLIICSLHCFWCESTAPTKHKEGRGLQTLDREWVTKHTNIAVVNAEHQ